MSLECSLGCPDGPIKKLMKMFWPEPTVAAAAVGVVLLPEHSKQACGAHIFTNRFKRFMGRAKRRHLERTPVAIQNDQRAWQLGPGGRLAVPQQ